MPGTESEDTFTREELIAAFNRAFAPLSAEDIVDDIIVHREPEWRTGDVVKSASNTYFRRTVDGRWQRFGTQAVSAHITPNRPLTLVGNTPNT